MSSTQRSQICRAKVASTSTLFQVERPVQPNTISNAPTFTCQNTPSLSSPESNYSDDDNEAVNTDPVEKAEEPVISDNTNPPPLLGHLNKWFTTTAQHSLTSYSKLLCILKPYHPELPLTAQTALKSLAQTNHSALNNFRGVKSKYVYFGITQKLISICSKNSVFRSLLLQSDPVNLLLSTDGVELYKCSATRQGIWPISMKVLSLTHNISPIVVAVFQGTSKPCNAFFADLAHEVRCIAQGKIAIDSCHEINIKIVGFSADSPARCICKSILSCNASFGCERCTCRANKSKEKRMCFEDHDISVPRLDSDFRTLAYVPFHQFASPTALLEIPANVLDFIKDFFLDVLHLVDEGVTKRYVMWFIKSEKNSSRIRLSAGQIQQLNHYMATIKSHLSREFQRALVSFEFLSQWKACTYRDFALYFGPLLLKTVLPAPVYTHIMRYFCALRILRSRRLCLDVKMIDRADLLLRDFVRNHDKIIGFNDCIYSVHSLVHLADDVRRTGLPLDDLSTYPFENEYRFVRDLVRGSSVPIAQLEKRLFEREEFTPIHKIYFQVPELMLDKDGAVTLIRHKYMSFIPLSSSDGFCMLKSGKIAKILFARKNENDAEDIDLNFRELYKVKPFFSDPMDSSLLGIYVVQDVHNRNLHFKGKLSDVHCKIYVFPFKDKFVSFPSVHTT